MRLKPMLVSSMRRLDWRALVPGSAILVFPGCTQQTMAEFAQAEIASFLNSLIAQYVSEWVYRVFDLA